MVVYVPALSTGGAERVAAVLASGFAGAGCRTTVLVDYHDLANVGLLDAAVGYAVLGRSHAKATLALAGFLRREKPDGVLAVGGAANVKLAIARRLAGSRVPIVLSYHGRSDVGRGRLGFMAYRYARVLSREAVAMVCVSDSLCEHLGRDWHVPAERLKRIYNPVPVERALAIGSGALSDRPFVVMSVGRLNPEKGFAALVAALPRIRPDARLVIHGDGPERTNLQALARELGVAERLDLPGYSLDPWPCYAQARCFALASPKEAFGNVVVEALASGLPVIATRSGGPDEILDQGRVGTLVDSGDLASLADGINRALADPGDPAPRVAHARRFSVDIAVQAYLALFRDASPVTAET